MAGILSLKEKEKKWGIGFYQYPKLGASIDHAIGHEWLSLSQTPHQLLAFDFRHSLLAPFGILWGCLFFQHQHLPPKQLQFKKNTRLLKFKKRKGKKRKEKKRECLKTYKLCIGFFFLFTMNSLKECKHLILWRNATNAFFVVIFVVIFVSIFDSINKGWSNVFRNSLLYSISYFSSSSNLAILRFENFV